MVKLRLKRFGRRNRPFYRICVMDTRNPRDGRAIEEIGFYDPIESDDAKALRVDDERAIHWLERGAQPSSTVKGLLKRAGIDAVPGKPKRLESAGA